MLNVGGSGKKDIVRIDYNEVGHELITVLSLYFRSFLSKKKIDETFDLYRNDVTKKISLEGVEIGKTKTKTSMDYIRIEEIS